MNTVKEKKRWPLTLVIIAAVVIASAAIIYSYRDAPGKLPVSAVSDGGDGIIVAWQDESGLYVQRINDLGQSLWKEGGITVREVKTSFDFYGPPKTYFTLTTDSTGGAIITWDDRSAMPADRDDPAYYDPVPFHSQRISAGGELLWNNTLVATGRKWQVVPDGTGGVILTWNGYKTYRRGLHDDYLYLQRIAPNGTRLWGDEGLLIVASSPFRPVTPEETSSGILGTSTRSRPTYEGRHYIVTDGAGGVIVLWEEDTGNEDDRVYAQRLDSEGNYVWPDKVTTAATDLLSAESDGEGGVKIGTPQFADRNTGMVRVYAHLNGNGEVLPTSKWAPQYTSARQVLEDSFRVRFEEDPPSGNPMERRTIIYIQRLDETGQPVWPEKRVINPPEKAQLRNINYLSDGDGGIIITWQLQKDSLPYGNIMALRLDADGSPSWGEEGIPVFNLPDIKYQSITATFSDGSGRIIVVAVLGKGGLSGDMIYAQRLDINGNRLWENGVRIDQ